MQSTLGFIFGALIGAVIFFILVTVGFNNALQGLLFTGLVFVGGAMAYTCTPRSKRLRARIINTVFGACVGLIIAIPCVELMADSHKAQCKDASNVLRTTMECDDPADR